MKGVGRGGGGSHRALGFGGFSQSNSLGLRSQYNSGYNLGFAYHSNAANSGSEFIHKF